MALQCIYVYDSSRLIHTRHVERLCFIKKIPCLDMTSHSISASPGRTIEQMPSESALQTFFPALSDPTGGPPFLADPDTFSFGISAACLPTPIAGLVQSETRATLIYDIS